mmetsp:Transcript_37180/g.75427  ORF Transcript_37180/g.75427 Transcript_37180/m.75427 type:complete len:202 (+) Transcript_37180:34-639(+)
MSPSSPSAVLAARAAPLLGGEAGWPPSCAASCAAFAMARGSRKSRAAASLGVPFFASGDMSRVSTRTTPARSVATSPPGSTPASENASATSVQVEPHVATPWSNATTRCPGATVAEYLPASSWWSTMANTFPSKPPPAGTPAAGALVSLDARALWSRSVNRADAVSATKSDSRRSLLLLLLLHTTSWSLSQTAPLSSRTSS